MLRSDIVIIVHRISNILESILAVRAIILSLVVIPTSVFLRIITPLNWNVFFVMMFLNLNLMARIKLYIFFVFIFWFLYPFNSYISGASSLIAYIDSCLFALTDISIGNSVGSTNWIVRITITLKGRKDEDTQR